MVRACDVLAWAHGMSDSFCCIIVPESRDSGTSCTLGVAVLDPGPFLSIPQHDNC